MKSPRRIHIVGIYGSGKSTLSKQLGNLLKIKVYDLDEIKYKRKYDKVRPVEERLKIVKKISNRQSWITEGPWLDYALDLYKKADLVIFLEIPEATLYKRILIRHFKRKGDENKYVNNNLKSMFSIMKNVRRYFHDSEYFMTLKSHRSYIDRYAKKVYIIKNNKDLEKLGNFLKLTNEP